MSPFSLVAEGGALGLDRAEVLRALSILIDPGQTFELRSLPHGKSIVCQGQDLPAAVEAAWELSDGTGLYFTLNPLRHDLKKAATNADVIGRRFLLVDIDTVRPDHGANATDLEKAASAQVAGSILDHLVELGWPAPLLVDSGNGWHLLFRVDLPNDRLSAQLIKAVLVALAKHFDTDKATVDRSVHNAARISKLPGTWVRKGEHTEERPHRMAMMAHQPDALEVVTVEQLQAVASVAPGPATAVTSPWLKTAPSSDLSAYCRSAIERECGRLAITAQGERNNVLNRCAFSLGTLGAWPEMLGANVQTSLLRVAAQIGLNESESIQTIRSGWEAGLKEPRQRPVDPRVNGKSSDFKLSKERDATVADLAIADAGTRWLWKGWIPLGVLTLLTAEPSTGKTRLGLDLTKRIVMGLPWPDNQPMDLHGRNPVVIWVPADNQHCELVDCAAAFGFPGDAIVLNTTIDNIYGGTELVEKVQLDDLEARIDRHVAALVLIDTITNTSDAKSQDTSDAKRQYKPLQDVAKRTGAGMICVTHTNIAGKTLGRRADEKTRVTIRMTCPDPERQPLRRRLEVALTRLSEKPAPLGITMGNSGNEYDGAPPQTAAEGVGFQRPDKLPSPAAQEAIGYLTTALRAAPMKISTLREECEHREPPIDAKQLYTAKKYLPIEEYEQEDVVRRKSYKWWRLLKIENGEPGSNDPPF